MNEMIGHIFGSLSNHEKNINDIFKAMRAQLKFNKSVTNYAIITTITVTGITWRMRKQEEKIKSLVKEIEELKEMKGE